MITVTRLSKDDALVLLEGAERKAREVGVPMCMAVVDESGNLIAFHRMDGGKVTSIEIAVSKAFTAACARRGTHEYAKLAGVGGPSYGLHVTHGGRFSIVGGGLPVVVDGEVVGGIGASTGTPEQDQAVAQGGIDYFMERRKQ